MSLLSGTGLLLPLGPARALDEDPHDRDLALEGADALEDLLLLRFELLGRLADELDGADYLLRGRCWQRLDVVGFGLHGDCGDERLFDTTGRRDWLRRRRIAGSGRPDDG